MLCAHSLRVDAPRFDLTHVFLTCNNTVRLADEIPVGSIRLGVLVIWGCYSNNTDRGAQDTTDIYC